MEYELYHYGVKGMKWGVVKSKPGPVMNGARRKRTAVKDPYAPASKPRKGQSIEDWFQQEDDKIRDALHYKKIDRKEAERRQEKLLEDNSRLLSKTYSGKAFVKKQQAILDKRMSQIKFGWSEVGGNSVERKRREVERKLDEARRKKEEKRKWENGAGKIKPQSTTATEARSFWDDFFNSDD